MQTVTKRFKTGPGEFIAAMGWAPEEGDVKAVLQIVHGMAEHTERYERLAAHLTKQGYAVCGHDHRGHGKSLQDLNRSGFFAPRKGWQLVREDLQTVRDWIGETYPGKPVFLFGHSMGSFVVRDFLKHSSDYKGVILSGTGTVSWLEAALMGWIASFQILFAGKRRRSELLHDLTFTQYNKHFQPARSGSEWLSRDTVEVEKYIADPLCGFVSTTGFYRDFSRGLRNIAGKGAVKKIDAGLPFLIISGDKDPVGQFGKGPKKLHQWLQETGHKAELFLNKDGRHESLNEINRDDIHDRILTWLDGALSSP